MKSRLPSFTVWFLSDSSFFSVIQAPNIHIDSYDENSLSFTLTMDGDIKVIRSSQAGSWVGLSFVQELMALSVGRLGNMKDLIWWVLKYQTMVVFFPQTPVKNNLSLHM